MGQYIVITKLDRDPESGQVNVVVTRHANKQDAINQYELAGDPMCEVLSAMQYSFKRGLRHGMLNEQSDGVAQ